MSPRYDWTDGETIEEHSVPLAEYDAYKEWMRTLGWTRVFHSPTIYVYPDMETIHKESIAEHKKLYG